MRILALEPYAALSHRVFLEGLQRHSRHEISLDLLAPRKWKWRMRTAALQFAARAADGDPWDLLFASDFVNLAELLALLPAARRALPAVVYFHENQLTYPLPDYDERDYHFSLIHIYSILVSARALFNSEFHRRTFFEALPQIVDLFPDLDTSKLIAELYDRTEVLPLGTDVEPCSPRTPGAEPPVLLWNHRWEHDKQPEVFFAALARLLARGCSFRVRVLGERFRLVPEVFGRFGELLGDRLEMQEFVPDRAEYMSRVRGAHVVVSTSRHEFFGLGTLEALRSGLFPVLPNGLSYPELLPAELRSEPFLYDPLGDVAVALEHALQVVAAGDLMAERRRLVSYTDRFCWQVLAPRFDGAFERAAGVLGKCHEL